MCRQLFVRSILSCLLLGDVPVGERRWPGIEGSPLQFEDVEPLCERTLDFCKVGWKDSLHTCLIYVYNKVLPYLSCLARSQAAHWRWKSFHHGGGILDGPLPRRAIEVIGLPYCLREGWLLRIM